MILNRLNCPCFDLEWVIIPGGDGKESRPFALICGGGGAAKSGVKNQIQIMNYVGENGFEMLQSFETGDKLVCSLSSATVKDEAILCAGVDGKCIIYTCTLQSDGKMDFCKRAEFIADDKEGSGCVNCCVVYVNSEKNVRVVTAGDEGVCRLWKVAKSDDTPHNEWKVVLEKEFNGHKGPIMSVAIHPTKSWLCSGSRDGTFKLWDLSGKEKNVLADVQLSDGTPGGAVPKKLECRGCVFSPDGSGVVVIQSGRTGGAHLVKWKIEIVSEEKQNKNNIIKVLPVSAVLCSKVPATKLKMNASEGILGVGSSDGLVSLFRLSDMGKIVSHVAHDMPVTGLSFCPVKLPVGEIESKQKYVILSCSVDYKLASMGLGASSSILRILLYIICIILLLGILCIAFYLHSDSSMKVTIV